MVKQPTISMVLSVLILGALLFAFQLSVPSPAMACSYGNRDVSPPRDEIAGELAGPFTRDALIDKYDAVFIGKANGVKSENGGRAFLFQVESVWKGLDETEAIVHTGNGGGDCGLDFQLGERYLVFAQNASLRFTTNVYDGTTRIVANGTKLEVYDEYLKSEVGKYGLVVTEPEIKALRPAKMPTRRVSYDARFAFDTVLSTIASILPCLALPIVILFLSVVNYLLLRNRRRAST